MMNNNLNRHSTVEGELSESPVRTWMLFRSQKWGWFSVLLSLSPQEGKGDRVLITEALVMETHSRGRGELSQMQIASRARFAMSNRWVYVKEVICFCNWIMPFQKYNLNQERNNNDIPAFNCVFSSMSLSATSTAPPSLPAPHRQSGQTLERPRSEFFSWWIASILTSRQWGLTPSTTNPTQSFTL